MAGWALSPFPGGPAAEKKSDLKCADDSCLVWWKHDGDQVSNSPYDQLSILTAVLFCSPHTEASKLVMSYVAAVCGKGAEVNQVKEQLLQSNPVLEGKLLLECVRLTVLPLHVSASPMSWLWKPDLLLFCTYLVSGTMENAVCEDRHKLFSYREVILKTKSFSSLPKWELRRLGRISQPPPASLLGCTLS